MTGLTGTGIAMTGDGIQETEITAAAIIMIGGIGIETGIDVTKITDEIVAIGTVIAGIVVTVTGIGTGPVIGTRNIETEAGKDMISTKITKIANL